MKTKFWGVRGSIPTPGRDTVKYGGNTSCVSVEVGEDLVILDGGSGLRVLGMDLMGKIFANGDFNPLEAHLFFSHVHWDHIQGIPFFEPMFIKGNKIHMYGEKKAKTSLEETLKGQQQYPNFPISVDEISILGAEMSFTDLSAGESVMINDNNIVVETVKLSHPDGVFAYKVTAEDAAIVYATDTEHRDVLDQRIINFCKKGQQADILIYDAQYTPDEYSGKIGMPKFDWGHSTYIWAVNTALAAGVETLVLFHHDPKHDDDSIDEIVKLAQKYAISSSSCKLTVIAATEGMML